MASSLKTLIPDYFRPALNNSDDHSTTTLKLLAHLVEETSDVLIAADISYRPLTWNKASEKIYGLKAEEVIGKDLRDFFHIEYANHTKDEVRQIINTRGEWRGETSFIRPTDKKLVTLLISFKELRDNHSVVGYLISATDISQKKETESRLDESEQRFRDMADASPVIIWLSDENNITTYTNKKWIEFIGKDISNDPDGWTRLIHPGDRIKTSETFHEEVKSRKQITLVYRLRRADGVYRWVHDTCVPRFLSNGKFIGYAGSIVDIEDEKQKHELLLYQAIILENVSDIVVTTDLEFNVRTWNKTAENYYNIAAADAVEKRISSLVDFTFYGTTIEEAFEDLLKNNIWTGEVSIQKNGDVKYLLQTVKLVQDDAGNKIGYLAIGKDITGKKIAEEKLKQSELFYRTLIADSLDGIILTDNTGSITFASPSVKNVLGFEVDELLGRNAFDFVHGEDILWALNSFEREVQQNPEVKFITVRLLKKNKEWVWCMVRGHNLLTNPHVNGIVIYFHDDTLRKQAKDALQESEKRFRSLIRDLQVGVFLSDESGNITMCNKALAEMFSIPEEIVVGKNVYDILSNDMINEDNEFIPIEQRPLTLTLKSKQTVKDAVIGVMHPITKERSWILVNSDPILDETGNIKHVVCSVMNLTERKKLEKKLVTEQINHQKQLTQATIDGQENERREIGKELHDNIGQQLTTIKLFLDHAKSTADSNTSEMVDMALKAVSDVINDVRAMSRSLVPFTLRDLGLVESINELIDSIKRTRILNIEFELDQFDESLLPENQQLTLFRIVQEQLNNIVKHARAKNVLIRLTMNPQNYVLHVTDDGKGFEMDKIKKGVGIMNIQNRMELFNGKAEISSEPGKGCTLMASFPRP